MASTADLQAEVAALRAELAALRSELARSSGPPGSDPDAPRSRRQLLRLAAAGAGGLGLAQVASASPAAAANGDALVLGSSGNFATLPTGVAVGGSAASYGLAATDNGADSVPLPSAILGHARGFGGTTNFSTGVLGHAVDQAFYGVVGDSVRCGVNGIARGPAGNGWPGVLGESFNGVGVAGDGGTYGVTGRGDAGGVLGEATTRFVPALRAGGHSGMLALNATQPAPPTSGSYRAGDVLNDRDGSGVWVCVTSGAPGSWRKVAGAATAGAFHPIDGVRAHDSRATGGRLTSGATRTITLPLAAAPGGSRAISYVLTAIATAGSGRLVAFPAHRPRPGIWSLSWWGDGQQHSVGLLTALSPARQVKIFASGGSTHFTVDVVGYYR